MRGKWCETFRPATNAGRCLRTNGLVHQSALAGCGRGAGLCTCWTYDTTAGFSTHTVRSPGRMHSSVQRLFPAAASTNSARRQMEQPIRFHTSRNGHIDAHYFDALWRRHRESIRSLLLVSYDYCSNPSAVVEGCLAGLVRLGLHNLASGSRSHWTAYPSAH